EELLQVAEVVDEAVDDGPGQARDLVEQAVPLGADGRVEGVAARAEAEHPSGMGKVDGLAGCDVVVDGHDIVTLPFLSVGILYGRGELLVVLCDDGGGAL